jgi:tetratricopeptide (TPR) repeat protein
LNEPRAIRDVVVMSTPEESLKEVEAYLEKNPEDAMGWNSKGVLLATMGNFGPALRALNRAIRLDSDLPSAHSNKGRVLLALGADKAPEALKSFDEALRLKPNDLSALRDKVVALRALGRLPEELKCLKLIVKQAPEEWQAWMRIGDVYLEAGKFKPATAAYDKVIAIDPKSAPAFVHRAISLSMLEDWHEAIKSAETACELVPDEIEAWRVLGDVNIRAGKNRSAMKALEQAATINPEDAQVENTMGMVEYKDGNLKEAIRHFRRSTIRDRKNARAYRSMALVSMELEEWVLSRDAWEKYVHLVKNDAEAFDALAIAYSRLGDFCSAADAWENSRKLFKKEGKDKEASRVTELGRASRINCSRARKAERAQKEHEKATRTFSDRHKLRRKKKER